MLRRQPKMDDATRAGLEEIAAYGRTWVSGHMLDLTARALPPAEHAQALAMITGTAAQMTERMRTLWLSRRDYLTRR